MTPLTHSLKVSVEQLRWKLNPSDLGFKTSAEITAHDEIIGQERGVEAFRFGMGMAKKGYNIFVTGEPGTGRQATVKKLLQELSHEDKAPDDLVYVNNFKLPEQPILLRFPAGGGLTFRKEFQKFLDNVRREIPQLFESEEYITRKNEIAEAHERRVREFYKSIEEKVTDTGLVVVRMQLGHIQRPDLVPMVDGEPKRMVDIEDMVEKGRFPRQEYERLRDKRIELKEELDSIVKQVKELQKDVAQKYEEVDRLMFLSLAEESMTPLRKKYRDKKVLAHLDAVLTNMADNLDDFKMLGGQQPQAPQGLPFMMGAPNPDDLLRPYQLNLLVDNSGCKSPPVIFETYPTYRNLFGAIDRQGDRFGGWRTDFTKIKAGSFVKANGGYLVINLLDAIMEPGVWPALKRSLKTERIEIETFDPYYFLTGAGLKPEPIDMDVKVVVLGDTRLYHLLRQFDPDAPKIFKVRADYESSMDRTHDAVQKMAHFVAAEVDKEHLKPFTAAGVAALVEEAVRMAGRQEKLSTAFPALADLLAEADYYAGVDKAKSVGEKHVLEALEAKIYRSSQIEDRIQEMIDRGSLFVDTSGEVLGQVNGLAVYSMGDHMFGKPSRITAVTSLGKEGIINIEREADLSGPTHNKGMLILSGWLRRQFAQDKPLSLAASIAFEQSYGGIDGDSASSTELYALLSSLSGKPIRQSIAVTGSVNQKGEVQPIGGVNQKIEGFYLCCKNAGLTGDQGVMIPKPNVKDLMLRPEVIQAVRQGTFQIWAVENIEQGIEILTGLKAGTRTKNGWSKGSIFALADARLKQLGESLRDFGKKGDDDNGKPARPKKKAPTKKK
ncbi:MAG: AAA family ATPase [Proteobacteria bacterium]|nr:AAA family ATPase [Pseudomonadota bacterium]